MRSFFPIYYSRNPSSDKFISFSTRNSKDAPGKSRNSTGDSILEIFENRGARIETRGTVYLLLSGTVDVGKYPANNAVRIWIICFKLGGIFTIELPTGMNISFLKSFKSLTDLQVIVKGESAWYRIWQH